MPGVKPSHIKVTYDKEIQKQDQKTQEGNSGCSMAIAWILTSIIILFAIISNTPKEIRIARYSQITDSLPKTKLTCQENSYCPYTKYIKFTLEKIEYKVIDGVEQKITTKEEILIPYSRIKFIHVKSQNEIPIKDKIIATSDKLSKTVYIFQSSIDVAIGNLVEYDNLISKIEIVNDKIDRVKAYLTEYRSAQGPPLITVYTLGGIGNYTGPSQYDKSLLYTEIIDLTKKDTKDTKENSYEEKPIEQKSEEKYEYRYEQRYEYKPSFWESFKIRR